MRTMTEKDKLVAMCERAKSAGREEALMDLALRLAAEYAELLFESQHAQRALANEEPFVSA